LNYTATNPSRNSIATPNHNQKRTQCPLADNRVDHGFTCSCHLIPILLFAAATPCGGPIAFGISLHRKKLAFLWRFSAAEYQL
jgi:hypothetical protein